MAASGSINAIPYQPIIDENCARFSYAYCSSGFASQRLNYFGYCIGLWDFSQITTMYQSVDTSSGLSADNQTIKRINNLAGSQGCVSYAYPGLFGGWDKRLGQFLRVNNDAINGPMYRLPHHGPSKMSFGEFEYDTSAPENYWALTSRNSVDFGPVVTPAGGWTYSENINTERTYIIIANYYEVQDAGAVEYIFTEQRDKDNSVITNNDTYAILDSSNNDSITHGIPIASGSSQQLLTSTVDNVWKMQHNIVTIIQREEANKTEFRINAGYGCPTQLTYHTISQLYNQSNPSGIPNFSDGAFTIGALPNISTGNMTGSWRNGAIYLMAVYGKALKPFEIECVESMLMDRYAIMPIYDQLVGWWDFTWCGTRENPNLFEERAGTTICTDGSVLGYVKNLAPGDSSGNKLGQFLVAHADDSDHRPIWNKDGGEGGMGYAEFGADTKCGLRGGYFTSAACNLDGGVSATKFSDLVMTSQNMTQFIVCKDDVIDSSGNYMYDQYGHNAINDTSASAFSQQKMSADFVESRWSSTGEGAQEDVEVQSTITLNTHLYTTVGDSGANGAKIYLDGTLQESETLDANYTMDFSKESNNTIGRPRVSMGCFQNGDTGATLGSWDGKIYECLVFAKTLSAAEIACVHRYISNKYGLTIS